MNYFSLNQFVPLLRKHSSGYLSCGVFGKILKSLLVMKLTALIILVTMIQVNGAVYSQTVRINVRNSSLEKIFMEIRSQTGYDFLYNSRLLKGTVPVTFSTSAAGASLTEILDEVFKNQPITYSIIERTIVVRKKSIWRRDNAEKEILNEARKPASPGEAYSGPKVNTEHLLRQIESGGPQLQMVRGKITDEKGESLPGVNILIKGTQQGTSSDESGNYSINVPNGDATLVFSFVGYRSREIQVGNQTEINISLEIDEKGLEEVVVVGFGAQKKVNLTGAVATINSEDLERRTVTKASQALQGQMSGISVRQTSGNPGGNSASVVIRGQGTFSAAGNSPLVLVDGIESSMDNVDPADIESVSVLKDAASASIFGSKAANGVILIETKKGVSGKPVFNYNMYVGRSRPTTMPEMVNSWEYAEMVNEAYQYTGQQPRYTEADIQKFRDGSDPINFPNFDHIGYLFESGSGMETKHDVSMRGGTDQTQYMFSTGYYRQNGLIMKNNADRYNVRLNLDSKLHEKLKLSVRLAGVKTGSKEPSGAYAAGLGGIVGGAMRNSNALHGPTPDGFYSRNETLHPEADLNSRSFVQNGATNIYGNASLVWNILKDLKLTGQVGYTQTNSDYKGFIATYPITPTYAITRNSLNTSWGQSTALTLQSMAEYNKSFNNHHLTVLAGILGQSFESRSIGAYRDDFPNNSIYEIDAGATARGTQSGSASRNTLASYFGRVNYNFKEKYLLEANFRYDGSSRFPQDNRWGLFPSFSAGWRISQESFFADAVSWISDLKLRASWGKLGNQSIGNYPYQDLIALGQNYPFGNELQAGGAVTTIANKAITWETTKVTDVGLDLSLFANRLSFTADYFVKETSDILYNVSVSNMLGASPSATNAGAVENRGLDLNLKYRGNAGAFTYGVSGVFSYVRNKVTKLANLERDINRGLFVGHPIGSAYGFVSDGLFANQSEVDNYASQPFAFLASPGGIKFTDLGGPNGTPDGVVDNTYDRRVIGMPLPVTTYGLSLNGGYKGFDVSLFFQGEGGRKDMITIGQFFFPLENNGNVQREAYENRWTTANPDPNATYPKMSFITSGFYNTNKVDFWYRNATFIRLKNAQIGYSLPKSLLEKSFLENVRIYASGENLFTLTGYYKGWDPEMQTGGANWFYPLTKLYVVGLNVRF